MKHSGKTEQKSKFRLPFSAVLLYLLLIAAAVSGVTFSKYVAGTTVGDTARVDYSIFWNIIKIIRSRRKFCRDG